MSSCVASEPQNVPTASTATVGASLAPNASSTGPPAAETAQKRPSKRIEDLKCYQFLFVEEGGRLKDTNDLVIIPEEQQQVPVGTKGKCLTTLTRLESICSYEIKKIHYRTLLKVAMKLDIPLYTKHRQKKALCDAMVEFVLHPPVARAAEGTGDDYGEEDSVTDQSYIGDLQLTNESDSLDKLAEAVQKLADVYHQAEVRKATAKVRNATAALRIHHQSYILKETTTLYTTLRLATKNVLFIEKRLDKKLKKYNKLKRQYKNLKKQNENSLSQDSTFDMVAYDLHCTKKELNSLYKYLDFQNRASKYLMTEMLREQATSKKQKAVDTLAQVNPKLHSSETFDDNSDDDSMDDTLDADEEVVF